MLHRPQQRRKRPRHKDDMQQLKLNKIPALLLAVSAFVLLSAIATFGLVRNSRGLRAAGLMPEVVCTADRSNRITGEIIVRAPRPDRLAGAVAHVAGINK